MRSKRYTSTSTTIRKSIDDRKVPLTTTLKEYTSFLSVGENKADLQRFLGEELLANGPSNKIIIVVGTFEDEEEVTSTHNTDICSLMCKHEEADNRIIQHVAQTQVKA